VLLDGRSVNKNFFKKKGQDTMYGLRKTFRPGFHVNLTDD